MEKTIFLIVVAMIGVLVFIIKPEYFMRYMQWKMKFWLKSELNPVDVEQTHRKIRIVYSLILLVLIIALVYFLTGHELSN